MLRQPYPKHDIPGQNALQKMSPAEISLLVIKDSHAVKGLGRSEPQQHCSAAFSP